jgi:hypothetical protein
MRIGNWEQAPTSRHIAKTQMQPEPQPLEESITVLEPSG